MPNATKTGRTIFTITSAFLAGAMLTGTVAYFNGAIQVRDSVNFTDQNGTETGAVLKINSVARFQVLTPKVCTATGGLSKYTMCSYNSPYTTTGALVGFSLECGNNVAKQLTGDVSFKKTLFSNTGTVLTNGDNLALGTGALKASILAVPVTWNPADKLTFSTLVSPSGTLNTTRYDCKFAPIVWDKYGS